MVAFRSRFLELMRGNDHTHLYLQTLQRNITPAYLLEFYLMARGESISMLVTLLIGMAAVGVGQLLRSTLANTAKALLEVGDMEATLEHQARNRRSSASLFFSGNVRNVPGNLRHFPSNSMTTKRGATCSTQQVDKSSSSIGSVPATASCRRLSLGKLESVGNTLGAASIGVRPPEGKP
jgi:hypothetical protein